jgi:hypothetical protein
MNSVLEWEATAYSLLLDQPWSWVPASAGMTPGIVR